MSSDLQSALTSLQQNNYVTVAILTTVAYDYVLTFEREIEYIWNKPWTWVSTLFIFVRYCGLLNFIISALAESSFLPGPIKMYAFLLLMLKLELPSTTKQMRLQGQMAYILNLWSFVVFLAAADFLVVLRVWALYNRSKPIFVVLLTLLVIEIASAIITSAVYSNPRIAQMSIGQLQQYSFCALQLTTAIWTQVAGSLQLAFGAAVCILAIVQFVRQSLQMYHATKQWQPNRYAKLLVAQGVFYFAAILLLNMINVLEFSGKLETTGWEFTLAVIVEYVPLFTLTPRLVLGIRELYAHDIRTGCGGIDSGFGLSTLSTGRGATEVQTMVFAGAGQNDGMEDVEEIQMEVRGSQSL